MKKEYLQCGYEHNCKNKECLKCPRRLRYNISLTLAEQIVIEEFAVCDIGWIANERPKQIKLMQEIMYKVMKKIFKDEDKKKKK